MTDGNPTSEVSRLLSSWRRGDSAARDQLMGLLYDELHRLAQRSMRSERQITLQPTALVNEAYMRLADAEISWTDRAHFFAVAATTMRRILVDEARRRLAEKRGGGEAPMALDEALAGDESMFGQPTHQLLALDEALRELATLDPRKSKALELRLFAGLTIEETAQALEVSHATVERDLKMARAWLANTLNPAAS
ncbi:MAG: sigma-70 family RNA polymerase sigma factor [Deltaproteobacteria bacterium]|nr:sigma-70 family RNA polymerase sigma factor [Deltaproteobacteria bacterium]